MDNNCKKIARKIINEGEDIWPDFILDKCIQTMCIQIWEKKCENIDLVNIRLYKEWKKNIRITNI